MVPARPPYVLVDVMKSYEKIARSPLGGGWSRALVHGQPFAIAHFRTGGLFAPLGCMCSRSTHIYLPSPTSTARGGLLLPHIRLCTCSTGNRWPSPTSEPPGGLFAPPNSIPMRPMGSHSPSSTSAARGGLLAPLHCAATQRALAVVWHAINFPFLPRCCCPLPASCSVRERLPSIRLPSPSSSSGVLLQGPLFDSGWPLAAWEPPPQ